MERLILDTGVLIAGVRGRLDVAALADADDVSIATITIAEYLAGTLLDPDLERAAAQRALLEDLLTVVPSHDYDRSVAEHHAALLAHVRRAGTPRGVHDLIIAATARATGRLILTTNERARYGDLPEVTARLVTG